MSFKHPILFTAPTEVDFYSTILTDFSLLINESISNKDKCVIGLCGGSTPAKLYEMLAVQNLPWEKIHFIVIDERYVPSDDNESNVGMIREKLLRRIAIPPENILSFDTSLPIQSAVMEMNRRLFDCSDENLFDILVLGVGEDGHIASLFENDNTLNAEQFASIATAKGYKTTERLTLTLKALLRSKKTLILLKGENKNRIFEQIKSGLTGHAALDKILRQEYVKVYFYSFKALTI